MTETNATRAAGSFAPACSHLDGEWEWRPRGFRNPPVPAYSVYCTDCDALLFTIIYDADAKEHRVGCPNFHTIKWQEYILNVIRKRFPNDRVVTANIPLCVKTDSKESKGVI